jgi:F-type H+-transporting ATPase subunit epsilon
MPLTTKLEVATPEEMVYSADVEMVTLPAVEGQMGLAPQHVRVITLLAPGEMIIRRDGRDELLAVGEGLIEVTNDHVSIATNMAVASDKIDEAAAEQARQRAVDRLKEKLSSEEVASVNASLARAVAQLRVKRSRR